MNKITNIIEELKGLTLLEASELVKEIEKTFNVDASVSSIPMMSSFAPIQDTNAGNVEEAVEEKTSFEILLTEVPAEKKIAILKIIRNVTGLGLKESKDIVDNVPKIVKEGATK